MLGYSIAKKWKWYCQTSSKKHNFVRKTENFLKKLQMTLRNYIQISHRRRERRKTAGPVGVFSQNLGITAYTLENYSNFKRKFLFNNGSTFEIHDYFRTRGNARFNDLSQLINTLSLSNQDFAGLDSFNKLENLFCTQGVSRKLN